MLPAELQSQATAIANGERTTANAIPIEAIPAYNITPDRLQYHPQGPRQRLRAEIGGQRVYIAGDTEDMPEMRALTDIDIAFLPMNLPYTMDVDQAADAVAAFAPAVVYPYHYQEKRHRRLHRAGRRRRRQDRGCAPRLVPRRLTLGPSARGVSVASRVPGCHPRSPPPARQFPRAAAPRPC